MSCTATSSTPPSPFVPNQIWAQIITHLAETEDTLEKQRRLATAARVSSTWHDLATPLLYDRVVTSDVRRLLLGIEGRAVPGLQSKRQLCARIRHLEILNDAPGHVRTAANSPGAGPLADHLAGLAKAVQRRCSRVRWADEVGAQLYKPEPLLPSLDTLVMGGLTEEHELVRADQHGLSALHYLSPKHIRYMYGEADDHARAPILYGTDPSSSLAVHIDPSLVQELYDQPRLLPHLYLGTTQWIIPCPDIISSPGRSGYDWLTPLRISHYARFAEHAIARTLSMDLPTFRVQIVFVLPHGDGPAGELFIETMTQLLHVICTTYTLTPLVSTGLHDADTAVGRRLGLSYMLDRGSDSNLAILRT